MGRQVREAGGGAKGDLGTGLEEGSRRWGGGAAGPEGEGSGAGGGAAGAGREARPRFGEGGQRTRERLLPSVTVAEGRPTLRRAVVWVSSPPPGDPDSCARFMELLIPAGPRPTATPRVTTAEPGGGEGRPPRCTSRPGDSLTASVAPPPAPPPPADLPGSPSSSSDMGVA